MDIIIEIRNNKKIGILKAKGEQINKLDDAVDLLGNTSYLEAQSVIIEKEHLVEEFFDLSTCFAGEVLQKFSNYRIKLAIVGDFSKYTSKSLRDFIYESNKNGYILFVGSKEEALERLS
jgi:hypothetical protein